MRLWPLAFPLNEPQMVAAKAGLGNSLPEALNAPEMRQFQEIRQLRITGRVTSIRL